MEEDIENELKEFNSFWDDKIDQYQNECNQIENNLINQQYREIEEFKEEMYKSIPDKPKQSKVILDFKQQIWLFSEQKRFKECQKIMKLYEEQEGKEMQQFFFDKKDKIRVQIEKKIRQKKMDLQSFKDKTMQGLVQLENKKQQDYKNILSKYKNIKQQMTLKHNNQTQKIQRSIA